VYGWVETALGALAPARAQEVSEVKRTLLAALCAVVLGGSVPALEAQDRRAHPAREGSGWLLENREALGLSQSQVTRLEEIARQLEALNRPLLAELRAAGIPLGPQRSQMSEEERRELHARLQQHRPTLMQLRQNTHAAMRDARAVLTREQLQRTRELMRAREEAKGEREHGRSPRRGSSG
jgi:hypothetical protein